MARGVGHQEVGHSLIIPVSSKFITFSGSVELEPSPRLSLTVPRFRWLSTKVFNLELQMEEYVC